MKSRASTAPPLTRPIVFSSPLAVLHDLRLPSDPPLAMRVPSGETTATATRSASPPAPKVRGAYSGVMGAGAIDCVGFITSSLADRVRAGSPVALAVVGGAAPSGAAGRAAVVTTAGGGAGLATAPALLSETVSAGGVGGGGGPAGASVRAAGGAPATCSLGLAWPSSRAVTL